MSLATLQENPTVETFFNVVETETLALLEHLSFEFLEEFDVLLVMPFREEVKEYSSKRIHLVQITSILTSDCYPIHDSTFASKGTGYVDIIMESCCHRSVCCRSCALSDQVGSAQLTSKCPSESPRGQVPRLRLELIEAFLGYDIHIDDEYAGAIECVPGALEYIELELHWMEQGVARAAIQQFVALSLGHEKAEVRTTKATSDAMKHNLLMEGFRPVYGEYGWVYTFDECVGEKRQRTGVKGIRMIGRCLQTLRDDFRALGLHWIRCR